MAIRLGLAEKRTKTLTEEGQCTTSEHVVFVQPLWAAFFKIVASSNSSRSVLYTSSSWRFLLGQ